jgi:capsular polysaccharide export protein
LPALKTFVGARRTIFRPSARHVAELDAIVGWGHKPSADAARAFARRHGVPYVALEDGFLRSVGLGPTEPPLSLVVDDVGIYYDARAPSRLERMLAYEGPDDLVADERLQVRARQCRRRIGEARLSKYNHAPDTLPAGWNGGDRPRVLVVDQTYDDASVTQGLAGPASFDRMLEAACDEHPDAHIVVKVHPATAAGHKRGYLADRRLPAGVERLVEPVNPVSLLEHVDHVYVCTSQLGFDALMQDKAVSCFGAPFYAGWGLTKDHVITSRRGRQRSIDELVVAALLLYPRYLHPVRAERCEAEEAIEQLAMERHIAQDNDRRFYCVGFSIWKRPFVRAYLASATRGTPRGEQVRFLRSARALKRQPLDDDATVVLWGGRLPAPSAVTASGRPVPVWRMEDGFLRSVALGSSFTAPGSLVLDRRGIYYDPSRPSELEELLAAGQFSEQELARAAQLRAQIVSLGVSKYNVATRERFEPRARAGQPIVLVVGQVEDDASVEMGSRIVRSNGALLREARSMRPDAHIIYKPHPDVLSGNRRGKLGRSDESLYDERVDDASPAACLAAVDEIHTMTSLIGFEALLRGKKVVTHGQPFYAGWGLTEDRDPVVRRTRHVSLDELVAATLLRYPRYFSWKAQTFCSAEDMVGELARDKTRHSLLSLRAPWLIRRARDVVILSREWLRA